MRQGQAVDRQWKRETNTPVATLHKDCRDLPSADMEDGESSRSRLARS